MSFDIDREFDRQVEALLSLGYAKLTDLDEQTLMASMEALRPVVHAHVGPESSEPSTSRAPFVLVVSEALARAEDLVPLTSLATNSLPGVVDPNHGEEGLAPYRSLPELGVPDAQMYALFDIERGEEFCGVRPNEALPVISDRGRTPLTVQEGIALVTLHPAMLEKNRCFMLAGSRRGDRRVPAMWISGKAPKLGWCWEGNPHTWLGMASAGSRAGAEMPGID